MYRTFENAKTDNKKMADWKKNAVSLSFTEKGDNLIKCMDKWPYRSCSLRIKWIMHQKNPNLVIYDLWSL